MSAVDSSQHQKDLELWQEVERAGGARRYVEAELRQAGVFVNRVKPDKILKMSPKQKKEYIAKLNREEKLRKPLQERVWRAYCAGHFVHLGEGVHWYDTLDIDKFDPKERERRLKNFELPELETFEALCEALGVTIPELRWFCYHREAARTLHYRTFQIPKKTGGMRDIWAPLPRLKALQKWVQLNIVERLPIHGVSHGFVPGRSIYSNAIEHLDSQVVVSMDLADFFPSFTFPRVKGIFRKAGYLEGIAVLLALICTEAPREVVTVRGTTYYVATGPRCLPQGSPASPAITNVGCMRLDKRLHGLARKYGFRYTRYADDLTFSYPDSDKVMKVGPLIKAVSRIVEDEGFKVRKDKTSVMRKHRAQKVTGLVVNGSSDARATKDVKRLIRAGIHNLKQGKEPGEGELTRDQLQGLAAFVNMSDPEIGRRYLDQLEELA